VGTAYTPPRKTVEPRSACGLITQSIYVPKASCQLNNDGKSDCRLRRIFFWYSSIVTCNTGLCRNVLKGRKTLIFSIKNLPVLGLVDMASNDNGVRTTVTTCCYPPLFQRSPARRTPPRSCAGNQWEVPTDLEGKLKSSEFTWIHLVLSCHRVLGHAVADMPTVRLVGSLRELPCFGISTYSQGSLCDFILCFSIVYIALGDLTRWFATSYSLLAWLTKESAWILLRAKSPSSLQQLNLMFGRFSMNVGGLALTLEGMCSN